MNNGSWMRGFIGRSLVVAALLSLGATAAWGGPYDSWGYHATVTFSGYDRAETLTNFPALVALSPACFGGAYAFSSGQFQSGANDLAFTDADGNSLNYEIDTWNPSGTSYVWVQVPALANNATVTAWWGAAGQSVPACTTNGSVWNGYAAVWHMGETNATDWTANRQACTSYGTTNATGPVGGAQGFNGSAYMNTPTNLAGFGVTTGFTVSVWFRSNGGADQCLMEDGNAYWDDGLYLWCVPNTSRMCAAVFNASGSYVGYDSISVPALGSAWHCAVHTYDGATEELLYDGASVWKSAAALGAVRAAAQRLHFGCRFSGGNYLSGAMDEVRIATVAQSSAWIWACYQNMASNAVFQSYGTVVASGGTPSVRNVAATNVTQTSACPNGLLTADGSSAASVTLYWGTTDGETHAAAWDHAVSFGANARPTPVDYTTSLTGLANGTTYYFRYGAANESGGSWASPSLSFTTLAVPVVNNGSGATNVFSSVATLTGAVAAGTPSPSVYVCWGTADGGATTTGAWQNVVALDVQSGAISTTLHGLLPGTAYAYRCYAVNSQGEAWSPAPATFTTAAWTLTGSTLTDGNWTLTVSDSGGNYTVTGCSAGSGDLDLRHTGYAITAIGYRAFMGYQSIRSLGLPDALVSVGDNAFQNCTSLTSVEPLLPDGLTFLGSEAFSSCPIVGALAVTNTAPVQLNGNSQFYGTKIFSATLGNGVTAIPYQMFYSCTALGTVSMSDGVTAVSDNAFQNCTSLTNVTPLLPSAVTYLGSCAFASCPVAGDLVLTNAGHVTLNGNCQFWGTKIASAALGAGVATIPYQMFYNCTALGSVSMSDGVTAVSDEAFRNCSSLTNVAPLLPGGLAYLGSCAFVGCPLAGDLVLTNASSVTLNGNSHFWQTKIASATLGAGVTDIPDAMFYACAKLGRVALSDNVTSIRTEAFRSCTSLTNFAPLLPSKLVNLGNCVFAFCPISGDLAIGRAGAFGWSGNSQFWGTRIASALLGGGVTNLPPDLFGNCTGLQRVFFCGGYPSLGSGVFQGTADYQIRTYIPKGHAEWQPVAASQVTALTADEFAAFQAAYPGEKPADGTWTPSGAGKTWFCPWVAPQDRHNGTALFLR